MAGQKARDYDGGGPLPLSLSESESGEGKEEEEDAWVDLGGTAGGAGTGRQIFPSTLY